MKRFIVQRRDTDRYLCSPLSIDGDEVWLFEAGAQSAHQFDSRKEAKDTVDRITNGHLDAFKVVVHREN